MLDIKQAQIMAMMDNRIDKTLRQLTSLKEYKRLLPQSSADSITSLP